MKLFEKLCARPKIRFPAERQLLDAPHVPGVYVIRKGRTVLHVGRTTRGKKGLHGRLMSHLHGTSSFTQSYYNGSGEKLRQGHTFQYIEVEDPRQRALLEAYAIGQFCPKHLGLGN